jgi:hypothetical protein
MPRTFTVLRYNYAMGRLQKQVCSQDHMYPSSAKDVGDLCCVRLRFVSVTPNPRRAGTHFLGALLNGFT